MPGPPAAIEQIALFDAVLRQARERRLFRGWVHAANSACVFTGLGTSYDAVRPGISAYGVLPDVLEGARELRAVMSRHSQVVFLKDIPAGARIGYAGTWTADRPTRIATLPVGYNDGLSWRLGTEGVVLVRGARARIVGRVSMDYTTIDVGHIPGVQVGDRATLVGSQGSERLGSNPAAQARGDFGNQLRLDAPAVRNGLQHALRAAEPLLEQRLTAFGNLRIVIALKTAES